MGRASSQSRAPERRRSVQAAPARTVSGTRQLTTWSPPTFPAAAAEAGPRCVSTATAGSGGGRREGEAVRRHEAGGTGAGPRPLGRPAREALGANGKESPAPAGEVPQWRGCGDRAGDPARMAAPLRNGEVWTAAAAGESPNDGDAWMAGARPGWPRRCATGKSGPWGSRLQNGRPHSPSHRASGPVGLPAGGTRAGPLPLGRPARETLGGRASGPGWPASRRHPSRSTSTRAPAREALGVWTPAWPSATSGDSVRLSQALAGAGVVPLGGPR